MADVLIENATIITVDSDRRVIEDGAIAIAGNKIVAVGPTRDVKSDSYGSEGYQRPGQDRHSWNGRSVRPCGQRYDEVIGRTVGGSRMVAPHGPGAVQLCDPSMVVR